MQIVVADTANEAASLRDAGFCPVECAFGEVSIVDALGLDHHGKLSNLPPVSVRSYENHFGRRASDQRFVVTGTPDADASFAMACLAGTLPAQADCRNGELATLARLIAQLDVDPSAARESVAREHSLLALFAALKIAHPSSPAWCHAVTTWAWLLGAPAAPTFAAACVDWELVRKQRARRARVERFGDHVALVTCGVWAFDIWYAELAPIILQYHPALGRVTIGCKCLQTVRTLLGSGGLRAVYLRLEPAGWGGRDTVGGSPRHARLSADDATRAAHAVAKQVSCRV